MNKIELKIIIEDDLKSDVLETILDRLGFITNVKSLEAYSKGKLQLSYTKEVQ